MTRFKFDLRAKGHGRPILLLPGSYATPAAWKGVEGALATKARLFSVSLPGYGTTPEVRPEGDDRIDHLVEFVGQVCDAVGEPVHAVGHSWGAHLLLAAVLAQRIRPISLLCFEANPVFSRPVHGAFSWRTDIDRMVRRFQEALAQDDPNAASIIIDFYSKPGAFLKMPERVREFCRATAHTNLRDWHSAASFTPAFDAFSALDTPVTLVRGSETPKPIQAVNRKLLENIPNASEIVVDGAGHFLISTHPGACAQILDEQLARA
jgi:pimeloyl-ACP methyl ester carboxylesterase